MPRIVDSKLKPTNVPVFMYHSVADVGDGRPLPHLSCPVDVFESHLQALQRAGFQTVLPQTLYDYMARGEYIPPRSVMLTFDDGYLDNWVNAYPLLKKYGFKATIFVNPEFVDPIQELRPTLYDVWDSKLTVDDLSTIGFLSWAEMREMERAGVMDIQSHALTHTWHFSTSEIIDFHHPGDPYMWLAWNACPERKHLWMLEDQRGVVPWGTPIYQYDKSLAIRRYLPDPNLDRLVVDYVRANGGDAFFDAPAWRQTLEQIVRVYRQSRGDRGRVESDREYEARVRRELSKSKQVLETQLGKQVNFLCWPGGGYSEMAVRISQEVGYLASTLSSRHRGKRNAWGTDPTRWGRLSPPTFRWDKTTIRYKGGFHFICLLHTSRGSLLHMLLYKLLRVPFKLSQWFNLRPQPLPEYPKWGGK